MGSKRIGLARFENLLENLKRTLSLGTATIDAASLTASTGDVTATAGNLVATSGAVRYENGGSVTQGTSKSTGVTLNTPTGKITMHAAALASDAIVTFTVTCGAARATDVCIVNHHSGGTIGKYSIDATGHASGSFKVTVTNISGGSLSEAVVLHYVLVQGSHT